MDALVKLYDLPDTTNLTAQLSANGVAVRHAMPYEKTTILDWICQNFSQAWADECLAAFNHQPVTCFVAVRAGSLVGFACYECTQKNYFGPIGIDSREQGQGIGTTLFINSLKSMRSLGYAYAIIGGLDRKTITFYKKTVSIQEIENSTPGTYENRIKSKC